MKIFFVTKKPAIPKIFCQLQVKKTFKMTEFLYMNSTSYNLKQRVCNLQNNLQFLGIWKILIMALKLQRRLNILGTSLYIVTSIIYLVKSGTYVFLTQFVKNLSFSHKRAGLYAIINSSVKNLLKKLPQVLRVY